MFKFFAFFFLVVNYIQQSQCQQIFDHLNSKVTAVTAEGKLEKTKTGSLIFTVDSKETVRLVGSVHHVEGSHVHVFGTGFQDRGIFCLPSFDLRNHTFNDGLANSEKSVEEIKQQCEYVSNSKIAKSCSCKDWLGRKCDRG